MSFSLGQTDKKWVSAFGIDKRDWLPQVINIENDDMLTDIMEMSNRYELAITDQYSDFVSDAIFILLDTTGATITGSGTAQVVTTLTLATSGYARPTDLIKFPNLKVGYLQTVTQSSGIDTLTINSVNGTNLTLTVGLKLGITGNAFGEASKAPKNRKFGQTQYTNVIQIIRDINSDTDIQAASYVELEYNGSHLVIDREVAIKALQFKAWVNATIIAGSLSTTRFRDASPTLVDPINGGAVQTTRGLDEYITTYGINDVVGTPGAWTFADLKDVITQLIAAKAGRNYILSSGTLAAGPMDDYLKGITTGISAGKLTLDGKELDMTVEKITYMNHTFQKTAVGMFDSPYFVSQTNIVKAHYYIPTDQVKTDGMNGGMKPRISMKYMPHLIPNNQGDEYIGQMETGALAKTGSTDDEMVRKIHWITKQGLRVLGAQHFVKSVAL